MTLRQGIRLLRRHLRPHRRAVAMLLVWVVIETAPAFASGLLVATAVDGFLAGRLLAGLGWLAALGAAYLVAAFATREVYRWLADTAEPLRDSLVTALTTAYLGRAAAETRAPAGASVAQATEQVDTVRELFADLLRNARQMLTVVVAVAGLTILSPLLGLLIGPMVALALGGFVWFLRVLIARQRTVILSEEAVTGVATPVVDGVRDVVACAAEEHAAASVGRPIETQATAVRAFARARATRVLILLVGVYLPLLALLAASPWLIAQGYVSVAVVAGAVYYLAQDLDPAFRFLVNAAGTWLAVLGVVLGRLAQATSRAEDTGAGTQPRPTSSHDIRVDRLTFAYSPYAEPVIRDLTVDIPYGTHLAVVGPSGVGKSTLADLVTGLVSPQCGEVRLGGVPVTQVREEDLRRRVALIPQEAYVFCGTVADNLAYLCPEATRPCIERAADLFGLAEMIDRLGGYDAEIPPGAENLSAGERQLVCLARVFLSPAEVVVLDEGTSNLDPVAEARAERLLTQRHGTLIVIAHRLSSAQRADRILVMDGADPVLGTHEDLLKRSTLYAELVGHWSGSPPVHAQG